MSGVHLFHMVMVLGSISLVRGAPQRNALVRIRILNRLEVE